ncbi:hypothetical protein OAT84_04135 [Gammaproteobacteria bacterium]|nr:hypothetical protein [Gammaproteobacteria bacterium]
MLKLLEKIANDTLRKVSFFRAIPINYTKININGKTVGGMAKPSKKILKTVTKEHKVIIVLMNKSEQTKIRNLYADAISSGAIMKLFHYPDFHAPTIKDFKRFFELYDTVTQENPQASPVIHCGAGNGRTGTMLAALMIRDAINKKQQLGLESEVAYSLGVYDLREQFLPKTWIEKLIYHIFLLLYPLPKKLSKPNNQVYKVCELVHQTLKKLRETRPNSVETIDQLTSLDALAKDLYKKQQYNNSNTNENRLPERDKYGMYVRQQAHSVKATPKKEEFKSLGKK